MSDPVITLIDGGSVILDSATHRDKILTFAGADTFVEGTVLATKHVVTAVTAAAVGGNTGNGTVTAASVITGGIVPAVGAYTLTCTTVVANSGMFALKNPSGVLVEDGIKIAVGAAGTTVVKAGGLQFTVTDGSTDFIIGDSFTLTVVADGTLVIYSATGVGGAQIATDVLTYEVTKSGAGTLPIRSMVAGRVRKERLVIDPATAVTELVIAQLRDVGITAVEVAQLSTYDNQ